MQPCSKGSSIYINWQGSICRDPSSPFRRTIGLRVFRIENHLGRRPLDAGGTTKNVFTVKSNGFPTIRLPTTRLHMHHGSEPFRGKGSSNDHTVYHGKR